MNGRWKLAVATTAFSGVRSSFFPFWLIRQVGAPLVGSERFSGLLPVFILGTGSKILRRLGVGKMCLMSAPIRFNALSGFHLELTDFVRP